MGLKPLSLTSESPFGPPPTLMSATPYGVNNFRTPVANYHGKGLKGRGASSKRPVLASGGTLEVFSLLLVPRSSVYFLCICIFFC